MNKNILITGGAGFIGTHICRQLTEAGYSVRVLDLQDPKKVVAGVQYIRGDVRKARDLDHAIQGVSTVYHFAAIVSVPLCQINPAESYQTNFMGTIEVLEAIRREKVRSATDIRIIFAGSSAVYGRLGKKNIPIKEEDQKKSEMISHYAAQKFASELAIRQYVESHQIPAVVFRFFNVFGPGQDPSSPYSGVISVFADRIQRHRRGEKVELGLNGGGIQTRDFISVHDVARANVLALKLNAKKCQGEAMNLGTGRCVSIKDLAYAMLKAAAIKVGKKPGQINVVKKPPREGDVLHSRALTKRVTRELKFKATWTLEAGMKELLGS